MTEAPPHIDPTRCPLCGGPNACAMTCSPQSSTCWCVSATFSPALLQRVPSHLKHQACICAACVQAKAPTAHT